MLVHLLSEIMAKQAWETVQSWSDPDVINGYIVTYGTRTLPTAAEPSVANGSGPTPKETALPSTSTVATPTMSANVEDLLSDLDGTSKSPASDARGPPPDLLGDMDEKIDVPTLSTSAPAPTSPSAGIETTTMPSSLPHDVEDILNVLRDPDSSRHLADSVESLEADSTPTQQAKAEDIVPTKTERADDNPQALPMNIPTPIQEPALPRSLEQSRVPPEKQAYKVRLPRNVQDVLMQRDSDVYDQWYTYLTGEEHGAQPREGAVLLQLHANLVALDSSMSHASSTWDLYTSDVHAVLQTTKTMLPSGPPTQPLLDAMSSILDKDKVTTDDMAPLRRSLTQRLQQLYNAYLASLKDTAKPSQPASSVTATSSPYEPRRSAQRAAVVEAPRTITVVDVSPNAEHDRPVDTTTLQFLITMESSREDGMGGYAVLRTWAQLETLQSELERMYEKRPPGSGMSAPPHLPAVKQMASPAVCQAIQVYLQTLFLPSDDGMTWFSSTQAVQRFLDKKRIGDEDAKRNNVLMSNLSRTLTSSIVGAADIGRKGVGHIAATPSRASRIFGLRPDLSETRRPSADRVVRNGQSSEKPSVPVVPAPSPAPAPPPPPRSQEAPAVPPRSQSKSSVDRAEPTTGTSSTLPSLPDAEPTAEKAPTPETTTRAPSKPSTDQEDLPSPQDVNALLTAVFAVTREALNMNEAWTLRRGMLRVLEQFLRTTYIGTASNLLSYFSSMLSLQSQVSWLELIRTSLWPEDVWNTETAPPRTPTEARARADEARKIVLSYVPPQAAYALGLGGKQAVADAFTTVHSLVTDPVVALDLHLALILRVLDLAMGTASGDRAPAGAPPS